MFRTVPTTVPHVKSGKLVAIAVTSPKRLAVLPEVPTVAESGYPGFRTITWNGLLAPARTPKAIIDTLAREVQRAIKDPAFRQNFANFGVDPIGDSPQEFATTIAAETSMWVEAVQVAGVKIYRAHVNLRLHRYHRHAAPARLTLFYVCADGKGARRV